jgi:putative ABC transport system permease protein
MRLYSLFLRLYPSSFRYEYGEEISRMFHKRRENATNPFSILWIWISEIADILINSTHAHWDILRQDLRYTLRSLLRAPGFGLTAIVVTGLGIGATTAAFSVTDRVLLHPFDFADSDRLVQLWQQTPGYTQVQLSPPNFYDWRKSSTSFEAMAAYSGIAYTYVTGGEPQRLEGTTVMPEFFKILGVQPEIGRVFTEAEGREGAARPVILSYAFWQSAFAGSAEILGKTIRLDDAYTVVGVMPRDFFYPSRDTRLWTAMVLGDHLSDGRDNLFLEAIGKLKPGVSLERARAEMTVIAARLEREYPKENEKVGALVDLLSDNQVPSQPRMILWALFGASCCVLLIACTNLANLLLAKAMARRKELSVRAAIGAGRERLVRQLLTESMMLAVTGGALGIVVAIAGLPLLTALIPLRTHFGDVTVLNPRVFAFATFVTLASGLVFGMLPAWRVCRGIDYEGLQEASRSGIGGRREWLRSVLVAAEITISIVLLVSTGLLVRALWRVQAIDPGFRTDSVLSIQTFLPMPQYALNSKRTAFYTEVLSNVRALPGVMNAGYISSLPMIGGGGIWPVAVPGAEKRAPQEATVGMRVVTPGYFDTLGIALRAGRDISESDTVDSPYVAVVSESFVRRYWPNQDPIGRKFHFDFGDFLFAAQDRTVVGVVNDVRFRGLERRNEPQVYLAYRQQPDRTSLFYSPKELVIRASGDNAALMSAARNIIHKADRDMPIPAVRPLQEVVEGQTASRTTQLRLIGVFAALALLLAGIGIHGLLSFSVGQRSAEFGLRIALGAPSGEILRIVLREGILLAGIGAVFGLILSYAAGRSIQTLLAGVSPLDAATLAVAAVVACAMTLSGSLIPAIRAMRTDPTTIIRG